MDDEAIGSAGRHIEHSNDTTTAPSLTNNIQLATISGSIGYSCMKLRTCPSYAKAPHLVIQLYSYSSSRISVQDTVNIGIVVIIISTVALQQVLEETAIDGR